MFYYSILFALISQAVMICDQNCASCRDSPQNESYCLACNEAYTQMQTSLCIPETTIANCATYDQSLNCLVCKPTFQTVWNICQRTFTGCLIFKNNKCFQCLPGAVLNNNTGTCLIQYLNCISINSSGVCTGCQARYVLKNGRCTYQSNNCIFVDKNTGLCAQCTLNSVLIGTTCVSLQIRFSRNCYLIDDNSLNVSCKYCKQGYGIYLGLCTIFTKIINLTQNTNNSCLDPEYLESNQAQCANISVQNCQIVDFGLSVCVFCNPGYDLINGTCIFVADNFCQTFSTNGKGCLRCKQVFYLKNNVCIPFPPYCISYSFTCTKCQTNFVLINGNCVDPYCQTVNPITRACQICQSNFKLNPYGVCKFMDPNCLQFNESGDCALCMKGYSIRSSLQYCAYQDLNCLIFDNRTGGCKMCKPFFAYNQQVQLCVPLPDNCETADLSGKCSKCLFSYNLVSDYTCLFIPSIANCQVINKDDYLKCTLCTNGSYADKNGICRDLPAFCAVYDSVNNQCQQCQDNGMMRNGNCVDKNCQIFDLQGGCLACIASYQFSSFGQCRFTPKDPNCKQFVYGICKSCVERYYFDFQFVCTAVSPLCRTYDANSGRCLTCYDGYELNFNGGCFLNIYNSIVGNQDLLGSSCKKYNSKGECVECYFGYEAVKINSSASGVECIESNDSSQNPYCIRPNRESGKCLECVYRMFVNSSGECQSIDENCNEYNKSNGVCISCYPGYTNKLQNNRTKCMIIIDADPNCQTKGNSSCLKCYSGFYYSLQSIKCVQVNQLCQTYNQTNGDCLSCYSGYTLNKKTCQISSSNAPVNGSNPNKSSNTMQSGCNQMNSTSKQCTNCDWGFALINGTCIQRDLNCEIFSSPNSLICLSCYSGYKTFGADQTKCILSTLIAENCLKYSPDLQCILCENGYILSKSAGSSPVFVCNIIDQNCVLFNSTLNQCKKCVEGAVLSGRFCIVPTYGIDQNCVLYNTNKLCSACKSGYSLSPYVCAPS